MIITLLSDCLHKGENHSQTTGAEMNSPKAGTAKAYLCGACCHENALRIDFRESMGQQRPVCLYARDARGLREKLCLPVTPPPGVLLSYGDRLRGDRDDVIGRLDETARAPGAGRPAADDQHVRQRPVIGERGDGRRAQDRLPPPAACRAHRRSPGQYYARAPRTRDADQVVVQHKNLEVSLVRKFHVYPVVLVAADLAIIQVWLVRVQGRVSLPFPAS